MRGPGRVGKPGGSLATIKDVFVVPQRPYMPMFASLADLVTYPEKIDTSKPENCERFVTGRGFPKTPLTPSLSPGSLTKLLQVVNVFYLVERCGWDAVANDWGDVLSLGEQQRISMARCFFQQPRFAILDQVSRALTTTGNLAPLSYAAPPSFPHRSARMPSAGTSRPLCMTSAPPLASPSSP